VSGLCVITDHAFFLLSHSVNSSCGAFASTGKEERQVFICRVGAAKGFAEELVGGPCLFAGTRGSSSCYKMCRWSGRMSFGAPRMAAARLALEWLAACLLDRFPGGV